MLLSVQSYAVVIADQGEVKEEALAWELEFINLMESEAESYGSVFTIVYLAQRSFDDALAESVTGEIFLFVTTC